MSKTPTRESNSENKDHPKSTGIAAFVEAIIIFLLAMGGPQLFTTYAPPTANVATIRLMLVGVAVGVTGVWHIVADRIVGESAHPGSFNQRLMALQAIASVWSRVPLLGVGFGGATRVVQDAGLSVPNIENEYLRLFLAAGLAGPVVLLAIGFRRLATLRRDKSLTDRISILAAMIGLLVDMATYNLFGWSFGPPLFFIVTVLALPPTRHGSSPQNKGVRIFLLRK
jgi:hypothetical protein